MFWLKKTTHFPLAPNLIKSIFFLSLILNYQLFSGYAGRHFTSLTNKLIPRITGLDPAR